MPALQESQEEIAMASETVRSLVQEALSPTAEPLDGCRKPTVQKSETGQKQAGRCDQENSQITTGPGSVGQTVAEDQAEKKESL